MRSNELKASLANIDQTIAQHDMKVTMGRLCQYVMVKNSLSGYGYDISLCLDNLRVTYFIAKDDVYKTKCDYYQLTPKQFLIVRDWLDSLITYGGRT